MVGTVQAIFVGVLLAGCSPASPPAPTFEPPPPVPTSAEPSPVSSPPATSTSPSPSGTLNDEQAAAAETVLEFFRLKNLLSRDPNAEVQPLTDITTGQTQVIQISTLAEDRAAGIVQTGDDLVYINSVDGVTELGANRVVPIEVCTDSRDTDLIDQKTGQSVLGPDRAYYVEWQIEVLREGSRWKVGDITSGRVDLCGP